MTNFAPDLWTNIIGLLQQTDGDITSEVESVLMEFSSDIDIRQWIIGDAIHLAGTSKPHMELFRKISGVTDSTLRSWLTTAKTWQHDMRWQIVADYPSVSWSMFKECNSIANDADYGIDIATNILKRAGDELFTVKQLRHFIVTEIKPSDKPSWSMVSDFETTITSNMILVPDSEILTDGSYRIKIYEQK